MPLAHPDPDGGSPAGMPRWVKVFGIVALVLLLLFVVVQFAGGGHGPGRHVPPGDTSSVGVTDDRTPFGNLGGHAPPDGDHR